LPSINRLRAPLLFHGNKRVEGRPPSRDASKVADVSPDGRKAMDAGLEPRVHAIVAPQAPPLRDAVQQGLSGIKVKIFPFARVQIDSMLSTQTPTKTTSRTN
jgi:hypothetical protein